MQTYQLGFFKLQVVKKLALFSIRYTLSEVVESSLKSLKKEQNCGFDLSLKNPHGKRSLVCHVLEPLLNVG